MDLMVLCPDNKLGIFKYCFLTQQVIPLLAAAAKNARSMRQGLQKAPVAL